jgi:hypothetical protein
MADRRSPGIPAVLDELDRNTEATEAMRLEAEMLRYEVARQRRWVWFLAALVASLALVVILGAALFNRLAGIAEDNRATLAGVNDTAQRLVECTEPSPGPGKGTSAADDRHECYERGLETQGKAVTQLADTNGNGRPDLSELLELIAPRVAPPAHEPPGWPAALPHTW